MDGHGPLMEGGFPEWVRENEFILNEEYWEYKSNCKLDGLKPKSFRAWARDHFKAIVCI